MIDRFCTECRKTTPHARVRNSDEPSIEYQVCDVCAKTTRKWIPPKKKTFPTEQYDNDLPPKLEDEPRAYLFTGRLAYPACIIHGALLRYQNDIWRCIECGFAIVWIRPPMSHQITLEISDDDIKKDIGRLAEELAIRYVIRNKLRICNFTYSIELGKKYSGKYSIKSAYTDPKSKMPLGKITTVRGEKIINGWYGDFVLLIISEKHGRKAIIFEIKYGNGYLTDSQIAFFNAILKYPPERFNQTLNEIRTYIVHASDVKFRDRTMNLKLLDYETLDKQRSPLMKWSGEQ